MSASNSPAKPPKTAPAKPRRRRWRIVVTVLCIPLLLCASYWVAGKVAFADTATLVELKGSVQTRHEDVEQWDPAHLRQIVSGKQRLRTGEGSGARLLFFDVSTVDLLENTEVSITRVAKRRGGKAVDVVLKTWIGKTVVRAVRFIDPSSTFRVDTPTASTVVRGARFTVAVDEEGTTEIELDNGTAEVRLGRETVKVEVGERITLATDGTYRKERAFEPDAGFVVNKVGTSWEAPEETFDVTLTETEINHFLAAMSEQDSEFFLDDTQIWFVEDEARIEATVTTPARFDLAASLGIAVEDGRLKPDLNSIAAGVALPIPAPILDLAVETILARVEAYIAEAYSFVEFTDVEIHDGYVVVTGTKQPDAPIWY